ncbi:MAG: SIMPL domain-containing protein [Candidatus Levybacteria bacterium]|nr:SIMPL domain-containing protein [Candidatus Levybacteria bacterium]
MGVLKTPLFTILFIFLGFLLYTKLFGAIPFSVTSIQTTKTDLFKVTGEGKATAVPNQADLSFGVTKTSSRIADAQTQVNTAINTILDELKKQGIAEKDIKTTNYSLYPDYDYNAGRNTIRGYTVTQQINVKVKPIDKINAVVDLITQNGANMVGGISFSLDDNERKNLQEQARKEAINIAKEKAQSLASLAGLRLGRIVDVQEGFVQEPLLYRGLELSAPATDQKTETNITPGENTVQITITLSYETR